MFNFDSYILGHSIIILTIKKDLTWVELIILGLVDFDIIMDMNWFLPYQAILNCYAKTVNLVIPAVPRVKWTGTSCHNSKVKVMMEHTSRTLNVAC